MPSRQNHARLRGRPPRRIARDRKDKVAAVDVVPFLPLDGMVVFPHTLSPLVVSEEVAIVALDEIVRQNRLVALFPTVPTEVPVHRDTPSEMTLATFPAGERQLSVVGVLARIVKFIRFPDNTVRVLVRGLSRVRFVGRAAGPFPNCARIETLAEDVDDNLETVAVARNAANRFQEIVALSPNLPDELSIAMLNVENNVRLVDLIADTLGFSFMEKLHLLALPKLMGRLQLLTILLNRESEVLKVGSEIQSRVHAALGKSQREYFLREQLKTIRKELGDETRSPDLMVIDERLKKMKLPEAVEKVVRKEMERLEMIPQASAEYHVAFSYIDWLLSVPWQVYSDERINVAAAATILDEDHYDLKDVKERILEFLAVLQLKKDRKSPILCFVGPPGVGKTSLGRSIARAMGRNFVRVSLGGVRDEAEIRGHRRTYVGALPGRIIQGMKRVQSCNPVFMLDEIDKLGSDFRGDPGAALLEVLDPEQNCAFQDHYIELDYDLSSVMFIATANLIEPIPPALLDRMELIRLPGYTPIEKRHIARRFLIPRQLRENGLRPGQLNIPVPTLDHLLDEYTREAGVRILERSLGALCRKVARKQVEGIVDPAVKLTILPRDLLTYLGPPKYFADEIIRKPAVGVAVGLAWTSSGGALLPVEVTSMPGRGQFILTGSLGEVMKESAQAAFSLIKHRHVRFKMEPKTFSRQDFHIHVPDGATPKDGPSAGVTMLAALVSHLTGRPIRERTAMTGEITLRGRVTPVGGIREKVVAAVRAGVHDVLLPEQNRKDLVDLPPETRKSLRFHFVDNVDQALAFLLIDPPPAPPADRRKAARTSSGKGRSA
jgi:ATP-dependent Lon protease